MEPRWSSKFEIKPGSWVFVPTETEVLFGTELKASIESKWKPPAFYYHLRDGGHVKALQSHVNHEAFLYLDISNFFGCINRSRVTRCLKGMYSYQNSRDIAQRSTVKNPDSSLNKYILPFGFVQSPIIASLCLSKSRLGRFLSASNRQGNFSVSVYMDDIIVSADDKKDLQQLLDEIIPISEQSKFFLNKEKQEGPSSKITAFNIKLTNSVLSVTSERFEEFKKAYKETEDLHVRRGIVGYVETVNKEQASELMKLSCSS